MITGLEWKPAKGGHDVLIDEIGEVLATVRITNIGTFKAQYGGEPLREFYTRDQAWQAMLKRHEEHLKKLSDPRQAKSKEKRDVRKDT